jgi:hypothetical protein
MAPRVGAASALLGDLSTMFTYITHTLRKGTLALALGATLSVGALGPSVPAHAAALDEQQLAGAVGEHLGNNRTLGQTFTRENATPVARVQLHLQKNAAAAGPLILRVLDANFRVLDSATRPAADFNVGQDGWYTFELGCDGAALQGTPFYGLLLESPASLAPNAYTWYGSPVNPYVGPATLRQGWFHQGPGWTPMLPLAGGNWDFTFRIFTC